MNSQIILADARKFLPTLPINSIDLIYIDPPFNTGKTRKKGNYEYNDKYDEYLSFLRPILEYFCYILKNNGSVLVHLDYREIHYVKVLMDEVFGRDKFMNEIIWCYDYGGRARKKYSCKHDTILWYVMNDKDYTFNYDALARIPYMAPNLVGKEKAKKGKTVVDWQFHTIVPTNSYEKTGYPTQKPLGLIERFVKVHSNPGDVLLDCFCGSGSFGVAAKKHDRKYILCDNNSDAIEIAKKRLGWEK
jgi:site-specific DNA-methyltransferase (adenine-specific)